MFELKMASNTQACNSFSFEYLTLWPNFVVKLYKPTNAIVSNSNNRTYKLNNNKTSHSFRTKPLLSELEES